MHRRILSAGFLVIAALGVVLITAMGSVYQGRQNATPDQSTLFRLVSRQAFAHRSCRYRATASTQTLCRRKSVVLSCSASREK